MTRISLKLPYEHRIIEDIEYRRHAECGSISSWRLVLTHNIDARLESGRFAVHYVNENGDCLNGYYSSSLDNASVCLQERIARLTGLSCQRAV